MKTLGFVATIVLVCVVSVAQADVIPGNLITNGSFDTVGLTGWGGGGAGSMALVSATPDAGNRMQINGQWESYYTTSYTFGAGDVGKKFHVTFDAGSLDASAAGDGLLVRLCPAVTWTSMLAPSTGYLVTAAQLNAGLASYGSYEFTVSTLHVGDQLQFLFDTDSHAGLTTANHVVVDNVTITTVPEPGTVVLLATGLIGLLAYAWRKRN